MLSKILISKILEPKKFAFEIVDVKNGCFQKCWRQKIGFQKCWFQKVSTSNILISKNFVFQKHWIQDAFSKLLFSNNLISKKWFQKTWIQRHCKTSTSYTKKHISYIKKNPAYEETYFFAATSRRRQKTHFIRKKFFYIKETCSL